MQEIVFLDRGTISQSIEFAKPQSSHLWTDFDKTRNDQIIERAKNASIIVNNKVALSKEILAQLPKLTHVAICATGTNCVDLAAAQALDISVSNVPGYGTRSVSEHVIALILSLRRNLKHYEFDINAGKWQASEQFCFHNNPILDMSSLTLGLIGTGAIAQQVATFARAFDMKVIYHSVSGRESFDGQTLVSLDELLAQSDIVSIHCPLTDATHELINRDNLKLMRKHAILINTARGSIVDLSALLDALQDEVIVGAGIDVAPQEPPQKDSPIMRLNSMQNCIVTPHSAWASQQAQTTLMQTVIANIDAAIKGEKRNLVT
jgi:glycerate dehydrogenase